MGHSRPLFLYFRRFYKLPTGNIGSIKVADDWIRTVDLWCRKRLLCQLNHNHCPICHARLRLPKHQSGLLIQNPVNSKNLPMTWFEPESWSWAQWAKFATTGLIFAYETLPVTHSAQNIFWPEHNLTRKEREVSQQQLISTTYFCMSRTMSKKEMRQNWEYIFSGGDNVMELELHWSWRTLVAGDEHPYQPCSKSTEEIVHS